MSVVLDTNAIVSGLNRPSNERRVLDLALRGRFELYLSPFILEEVAGVLVRKFGWTDKRSSQALRAIGHAATVIEAPRLLETIEGGHADNRILESAAAATADYLVTGDRRHLLPLEEHGGARILNAPPVPIGAARVLWPRRDHGPLQGMKRVDSAS